MPATIEAVEHVDRCLGRVLAVLQKAGARIIVTADHGNAEEMIEPDGSNGTAHSTDKVPLVVLERGIELQRGSRIVGYCADFAGLFGHRRTRRDDGCAPDPGVNNSFAYTKAVRLVVTYVQRSSSPWRAAGFVELRTERVNGEVRPGCARYHSWSGRIVACLSSFGKDSGLSTTFGGTGAFGGSGVVQKNLDYLTIGCSIAFVIVSIALAYIV